MSSTLQATAGAFVHPSSPRGTYARYPATAQSANRQHRALPDNLPLTGERPVRREGEQPQR